MFVDISERNNDSSRVSRYGFVMIVHVMMYYVISKYKKKGLDYLALFLLNYNSTEVDTLLIFNELIAF